MEQKTPLGHLLDSEVTRKEFLVLLSSGLLSVLGFSSIIHFLTGKRMSVGSRLNGYGSSSYGR